MINRIRIKIFNTNKSFVMIVFIRFHTVRLGLDSDTVIIRISLLLSINLQIFKSSCGQ